MEKEDDKISRETYIKCGFPTEEIEEMLSKYEKEGVGCLNASYVSGKIDGIYEILGVIKDFVDEAVVTKSLNKNLLLSEILDWLNFGIKNIADKIEIDGNAETASHFWHMSGIFDGFSRCRKFLCGLIDDEASRINNEPKVL